MTERRGKYNARPTEIDGHRFDSEAEARKYGELRLLERAGAIRTLVVHPAFEFVVNGVRVGQYESDFSFIEGGEFVVLDVKGFRTREYLLKRKLMKACYGIDVREVRA